MLNYRSRFLAVMINLALVTCVLLSAPRIYADSVFNQLKDPSDGWFDASDWVLNNAVGFMPVPIIITEPAVGEGLGLAAIFFHPPKGYSEEQYAKSGLNKDEELPEIGSEPVSEIASAGMKEFVLPDMTAAVYAKTNNGTWLGAGRHLLVHSGGQRLVVSMQYQYGFTNKFDMHPDSEKD